MNEELKPCRYCKCSKAEPYRVGDLWYVRCRGSKKATRKITDEEGNQKVETYYKKCDSWNAYEFLGLTKKAAIENWNLRNS